MILRGKGLCARLMRIAKVISSVKQAQKELSRLIERAEKGQTVIISRRGKAVAQLTPPSGYADEGSARRTEFERRKAELAARRAVLQEARQFARDVRLYFAGLQRQREADKAIREGERKLRQVLDAASEAVLQVDHQGRILLCNRATEKMFGYGRSELLHLLVEQLVPEPFRQLHVQHREDYHNNPRVRAMAMGRELLAQKKDGTLFPVEIGLSPHLGGESAVIVLVHDITERKRVEDAVRRSDEKLRQAEKLEALARMAGGTAHEFNNLLTMIMGYSALMLTSIDSKKTLIDYVEKISHSSRRAADLTHQLLAFSRRQILSPQVINLNVALAKVGDVLPSLLNPNIKTVVRPAPEPVFVRVDRSQLHQVIVNLVINARDAMPEGGRLTMEISSTEIRPEHLAEHPGLCLGKHVVLAVSDSGTGITREVQSRLFEPFFSTRRLGKGVGLGLAAIYGIVQQSGGTIAVESRPGNGATFKVYLPQVRPEEAYSPAPVFPTHAAPLRGNETILMVEDEDSLRAMTREFLCSLGYNVLEAADGKEAIRVAGQASMPIHLLLTDVIMPEMTGPQLARKIVPMRPGMNVLYVSGYIDDAFTSERIAGSKEAFLEKPFAFDDLARKIRDLLSSSPSQMITQVPPSGGAIDRAQN